MSDDAYRILICDDDLAFGEMLGDYLTMTCKCSVKQVHSEQELWPTLEMEEFDVLFLDYQLPHTTGLAILEKLSQSELVLPTVMMTGQGSEQIAARAIQSGALDYLVKGNFAFHSLGGLVEKAVQLRQLQRIMRESLQKIQYQAAILNSVGDAVVVWNTRNKITYWNRSAEQLYHREASEMLGHQVDEVYFPIFQPPYPSPIPFDQGIYQSERWFETDGQDRTWVNSQISSLVDSANGQLIGYIDVTRDVSLHRMVDERLQNRLRSEQLLSHLSSRLISLPEDEGDHSLDEALAEVAQVVDAAAGLIYLRQEDHLLNLAAGVSSLEEGPLGLQPPVDLSAEHFPWRLKELLTLPLITVPSVHRSAPEILGLHSNLVDRGVDTLVIVPMVYNGELFGALLFGLRRWSSRWEKDYDYLLRSFGEILLKALLQKQTSQALHHSETLYRLIVEEHQTEMICRFLPDFCLTFANEAYLRYHGINREGLETAGFTDPVVNEDRSALEQLIAGLTVENPIGSGICRVKLNGVIQWQEWVIRAITGEQSRLVEFQAVGRDITERKQMEEQIQAAQARLTQATRLVSIGQLASSVAHQLSNPLTTIIADAQLLQLGLPRDDPGRESTQAITSAGWRAQQVVNELMKFSQDADEPPRQVAVKETFERALLLVRPHIEGAGILLVSELPDDLPEVYVNSRQIIDLWTNLLLTIASQAGERKVKKIIFKGCDEKDLVMLKLSHDGTPVAPDDEEMIFEPQLVPTSARWGTGMELTICREIVRQHHGQISVHSDGNLTTFAILLPKRGPQ